MSITVNNKYTQYKLQEAANDEARLVPRACDVMMAAELFVVDVNTDCQSRVHRDAAHTMTSGT